MHKFLITALAWLCSFAHPKMELATVGDDYAVFFKRKGSLAEPVQIDHLEPGHQYKFYGKQFSTLERPAGKLLARFVTVNDVHIGESICGFDSRHPKRGPILRNEAGQMDYAEMMSRNAVDEISKIDPEAVLVKGDITDAGLPKDFQLFKEIWGGRFGNKLHWVCGNHDVHSKGPDDAPLMVRVDLAGVTLALLDTTIEGKATGQIRQEQLAWLDRLASTSDRPVMVFGHHHIWNPNTTRDPHFFGINPDDSEKLIGLFQQHKCLIGYFSGHSHSNHVQNLASLPGVPFAECGALKEFPGAWNEYIVYENGIQQVMHRLTKKKSLQWAEKTSKMEQGNYEKRHYGKLSDRCFNITPRM